jgi:hypothetical protein
MFITSEVLVLVLLTSYTVLDSTVASRVCTGRVPDSCSVFPSGEIFVGDVLSCEKSEVVDALLKGTSLRFELDSPGVWDAGAVTSDGSPVLIFDKVSLLSSNDVIVLACVFILWSVDSTVTSGDVVTRICSVELEEINKMSVVSDEDIKEELWYSVVMEFQRVPISVELSRFDTSTTSVVVKVLSESGVGVESIASVFEGGVLATNRVLSDSMLSEVKIFSDVANFEGSSEGLASTVVSIFCDAVSLFGIPVLGVTSVFGTSALLTAFEPITSFALVVPSLVDTAALDVAAFVIASALVKTSFVSASTLTVVLLACAISVVAPSFDDMFIVSSDIDK